MKTLRSSIFILLAFSLMGMVFTGCNKSKDEDDNSSTTETKLVSLKSPYLICAGRNPGGVGFDFEYNKTKGGANNMDSLSVADFKYDLKIRTIKGEKPSGGLGGAPFIKLSATTQAVNYSEVDPTCKGLAKFKELNSSNIKDYTLKSDNSSFNITSLTPGPSGKPFMKDLMKEYSKLVIGIKWKEAANNDAADDEPIWIIKTDEGKLVKFIVVDFPANPAPTTTGYINIEWDFLDK